MMESISFPQYAHPGRDEVSGVDARIGGQLLYTDKGSLHPYAESNAYLGDMLNPR